MAETQEVQSVTPEELQTVLRNYRPEPVTTYSRDLLAQRYRLLPSQPIAALSSFQAKAVAAEDTRGEHTSIYALIFDSDAIVRKKHITALKEFRHPNLLSLLEEGMVEISTISEVRYVVLMERPVGTPLSKALSLQQRSPVSETAIVNYLLRPFTEILRAFEGMGISHNRINLDNVYINNATLVLGECISDTAGVSQNFLFETTDRLLCLPWGKQDYAIDADCHALGMVALHLLIGFQPFANIPQESFIESLLVKGSYHTVVIQWDISDHFQDIFRALLNDSKRDRCAPEHIESWLAGRHFNLILPLIAQETARGFDLCGKMYFNRKALAHAMFQNWNEAKALLFDSRLPRWLETSIHRKDQADIVARIASNTLGDTARAKRQNNELLARIIMVLDPKGPVRFKELSFAIDGAPLLLTRLYLSQQQDALHSMLHAMEADLTGQWIEYQKGEGDYTFLGVRLQKIRSFLRMRSPGFGVERCIYDNNPALPCLSPLLRKMGICDLPSLLLALDSVSTSVKAATTDFMDAHIAAFIASKLDLGKEIKIHELEGVPEISSHPMLIGLKLFTRAQTAAHMPIVRGFTHWIALRFFPMLELIHRRVIRHRLQRQMKDAASSGKIASIASIILSPDAFLQDYHLFNKALTTYAARKQLIAKLNDPHERARHARMLGRAMAQLLAYGGCLFTIYFTTRSYYHL